MIVLPWPVSVNKHMVAVTKGYDRARLVKTTKAKRYQRAAAAIALMEWIDRDILTGRLIVSIAVHPPTRAKCDVDNYAKVALDALNGIVWEDDSQIDTLVITRGNVIAGGQLSISVQEAPQDLVPK